jgi:hypothetical protein
VDSWSPRICCAKPLLGERASEGLRKVERGPRGGAFAAGPEPGERDTGPFAKLGRFARRCAGSGAGFVGRWRASSPSWLPPTDRMGWEKEAEEGAREELRGVCSRG